MNKDKLDAQIVQEVVPYQSRSVSPAVLIKATPIANLRPVESGPGLVVCDPVAAPSVQSNGRLDNFGIACGRWLHLVTAGQQQFGRTPSWGSLSRAIAELGRSDLGLDSDQAYKLTSILGATHAAVGTINGTPAHCELSYQLYDLVRHKPVGRTITASGSEEEILRSLPAMAQIMASELEAGSPAVPHQINSTPEEMQMIGSIAWNPDLDQIDDTTIESLAKLAPRNPVAGLIYMTAASYHNEVLTEAAARTLFSQLPNNPIPYVQLAQADPIDLVPYKDLIVSDFQHFSKNYLFATADIWLQRDDHNAQAERRAAEQIVRDAPRSPDAWIEFDSTLSNESDDVRLGRWSSLISPSEQTYLDARYAESYHACRTATELDPLYMNAWKRLAQSATFDGQADVADQAFSKAAAMDGDFHHVVDWGLQMYQPKWLDDSNKLQQVASLAASRTYPNTKETLDVYDSLLDAGFDDAAANFLGKYEDSLQAKISANPNDGYAHWHLANCYAHGQRNMGALREYKIAARLLPHEAVLYDDLGNLLDAMDRIMDSIAAYQQSVRLDPDHKTAHFDLAFELKRAHKLDQAEQHLKIALRLSPGNADAHCYLGIVYYMKNKKAQAVPELEAAIRCDPENANAYDMLGADLDDLGRYDQSIKVFDTGLLVDPGNEEILDDLADDYQASHQYDKCIQVSDLVLQADPNDLYAHEKLGQAYFGKGERAKAISEWRVAAQDSDPSVAKEAKAQLAKYQ